MTKIYTKTGDKGETGLFGGDRVSKDSTRIEAYGSVDELNSFIGLTIAEVKDEDIKKLLLKIQNELFVVGSNLATPDINKDKKNIIPKISEDFFKEAENAIDHFEGKLEPLKHFILPGGSKSSALLNVCRTVCRRAERRVVALNNTVKIDEKIIIFLNRLSDLFFVLARYENQISGNKDVIWKSNSPD